jgi:hypothetical protein
MTYDSTELEIFACLFEFNSGLVSCESQNFSKNYLLAKLRTPGAKPLGSKEGDEMICGIVWCQLTLDLFNKSALILRL